MGSLSETPLFFSLSLSLSHTTHTHTHTHKHTHTHTASLEGLCRGHPDIQVRSHVLRHHLHRAPGPISLPGHHLFLGITGLGQTRYQCDPDQAGTKESPSTRPNQDEDEMRQDDDGDKDETKPRITQIT